VEAAIRYRFAHLRGFKRSWRTLVARFLRPCGVRAEMRIGAEQLARLAQLTFFLWGTSDPFGGNAHRVALADFAPGRSSQVRA